MNDYGNLKSGTDIRGRAIATDGKPAVLTEKAVADIAAAFALWICRRVDKPRRRIAIGRDSRITGEQFQKTIIATLRYAGLELFDCGMITTPAAFLTTQHSSIVADGAIMITASHHPMDINGLKFFTQEGGVNSKELDEIIELANNDQKIAPTVRSTIIPRDFLRVYADSLADTIRKGTGMFHPFRNMKIAVDAGHGAGGYFATKVLKGLGADISPSQFLEPDGTFPAHPPNPENAEAMESLKNRVLETGADLGIIFDADGDRCAVVTPDGTEVNRCRLIALAAAMVLPDHPNATIVTDSVTTEALRQFIESRGGIQKRFKRGYRNVIDEAKRLCDSGVDAPLAIESSGHVAFREHFFLDDGAYFVVKILITLANLKKQGCELVDLIADLDTPLEEGDIRLNFTCDDWREKAETIITRLTGLSERLLTISGDNYEGVRAYVSHGDGYFIVRTSVHDPVLPIYIESNKRGGAHKIASFLYSFLNGFTGLDCAPLEQFLDDTAVQNEYADGGEAIPEDDLFGGEAEIDGDAYENADGDSDGAQDF
ncbi:MAG: phosphomannomutase/phosphoglucomutase [Clostridiales bacterium]|nr:phosphomannomutase/phosphoglucomutase [Clostridiales bacterium]